MRGRVGQTTILVAGGAGYIGSHFCWLAKQQGFNPVIIDRIVPSSGMVAAYRRSVVMDYPHELCDIADSGHVRKLIAKYKPKAAVSFAGLIDVAESMIRPSLYWEHNFNRAIAFFETLLENDVRHLVFSSSAAVYLSSNAPLAEDALLQPANPYGLSKLAVELALQGSSDHHRLTRNISFNGRPLPTMARFGALSSVILRYFNAGGGLPAHDLGEMHDPENHLIPRAVQAAAAGDALMINGEDYDTPDGTCLRDYVHVLDLAEAHIKALGYLLAGGTSTTLNLGSGKGTSVRQIAKAVSRATGHTLRTVVGPRRAGDASSLIADITNAGRVLGWKPARDLNAIVASAAAFHDGYAARDVA